ncbi:CLUMA_CG005118, isoform A [Clunio marinus]|uniref:CLUMA_CG005118, isoform A n=1 Tax=Clunio marinus TaxID=568069 RepID=A0A1J1HZ96_9DIPT|nr:CLUMA_CG005118, isoform A [Clunio marinus]
MAWYEIPNTNAMSIYFTIVFGIFTVIFVFRLWLKATCGKFTSNVRMDGKTVLITGGNSGIGKETAKDLAKRGARVIMACRTMDTANKARDEIVKSTGNQNVVVMKLDLSSQQSIRDFSKEFLRCETRLDLLIHNAGYAGVFKKAKSVDGIELTMATNHYGPFLLTHLVINLMKKSSPARIVVVSSKYHHVSTLKPTREGDLNPIDFWLPGQLYNNSKFANILFTLELAKRLKRFNITVNCLHPGMTNSKIWRNYPICLQIPLAIFKFFLKNSYEGCQTTLFVALSPDLNFVSGRYFRNCRESRPNARVFNKQWQTILWDESRKLMKLTKQDPII